MENGRPGSGTCNHGPDHDFIELFQNSKHRIFSIAAPLYRQSHSLNEISSMTGIPYSTLNYELKKKNVQLLKFFGSRGHLLGAVRAFGPRNKNIHHKL
jgi:hypothetical protein